VVGAALRGQRGVTIIERPFGTSVMRGDGARS